MPDGKGMQAIAIGVPNREIFRFLMSAKAHPWCYGVGNGAVINSGVLDVSWLPGQEERATRFDERSIVLGSEQAAESVVGTRQHRTSPYVFPTLQWTQPPKKHSSLHRNLPSMNLYPSGDSKFSRSSRFTDVLIRTPFQA